MYFLWFCYETQLTNTKTKPSQTSQLSRARDGRGMGEVCLDKFLRTSSNCIKPRTSCPECYHCGSGVSSTCVCMISQRYGSGTISTPQGGAVGNGALLDSAKALNLKDGNKDEQDFGCVTNHTFCGY